MSLSSRTILPTFKQAEFSELLSHLVIMLQGLELETKKLLGHQRMSQLARGSFNKKTLEELVAIGMQPAEKFPVGIKKVLSKFMKFKNTLLDKHQAELDNTIIELPTQLGTTRRETFADICYKEQCIFTSQIFLWQLVLNSGTRTAVPAIIRDLAKLFLLDPQVVIHTPKTTVVNFQTGINISLTANMSYRRQLETLRQQFPAKVPSTSFYGNGIALFAPILNGTAIKKSAHVVGNSTAIADEAVTTIKCKA